MQNIFTEAAGSRKAFPKVAMIITDGKSQDPVEEYAKRLRNIGVEIFVLGMVYYSVFCWIVLSHVNVCLFLETIWFSIDFMIHIWLGKSQALLFFSNIRQQSTTSVVQPLSTYELMLLRFTFSHSGIKGADEDELREIASTPHSKHVYNVPNFDMIQEVQKKIITEVCSGVDEQLSSLVSGEESK